MSTKTTLKRIALVAVSALGFGVLTAVAPSNAAIGGTGSSTNYTSNITLSSSSYTVVASATDGTAAGVRFYVDTTNLNGTTSTADGLQTGETLTVTVVGKTATGADVADLAVHRLQSTINHTTAAVTYSTEGNDNSSSAGVGSTLSVTSATSNAASANGSWSATGKANNEINRYWFGLVPDSGKALGSGAYTVRVRLNNANSVVIDKTLTVTWVPTIADAGATLTVANSGTIRTGAAYAYTANGYTSATLKDANGGRVVLGLSNIASGTDASTTPSLDAAVVSSAGAVVETSTWSASDTGADGTDYAAGTGTEPTAATCQISGSGTCISLANSEIIANRANGVYGITSSSVGAAASTTNSIRVRLLNSATSATAAVTIAPTNAATSSGTKVTATAAGLKATDKLARTVAGSGATASISYNVPTTTSSVSLYIDTNAAGGSAISSNVTWSGNYASANVTPASDTTVVNYVDGDGAFNVALTNTNAVSGSTATVTLTGFAAAADAVTITVNFQAPVVTAVAVLDPVSGVYVKTKSATTFTVRVRDQFDNNMSGQQLIPSLSSTSANYSATTTYAPITTGATGTATWTLTDAAGTDTKGDSVTFTSVTDGTKASTPFAITYRATLPDVAQILEYYSHTLSVGETVADRALAVPSTGIVGAAGNGLSIVIARDQSNSLNAFTEAAGTLSDNDMIAVRIRALTAAGVAATGASVTLTAPAGGHVLNSSGLPATSRTNAVNSEGDVYFRIMATATGTLTFTVTAGTVSDKITLVINDQDSATGRTVSITGGTTGAANGAGVPMTVSVRDRFGNPVKNVNLTVTASGVGAFMGGATSQSFTTDRSGNFTFLATSYTDAGGSATYSARATNATDTSSLAGYVGATAVDSTLAAGVSSASATVTFSAGVNAAQAAADAAADAAAEAIDAANAATDAANLAAEAADAATVAAEEARDAADAATAAVEELATQVATLMAALKAQITTLANTVAKIAKKVKA